ncbi:MAG TPA: hypothetical protein VN939_14210 [Chthoniobacterales bacterium]|nr:hypothetical protein [Chthoniobacterales bacterium]
MNSRGSASFGNGCNCQLHLYNLNRDPAPRHDRQQTVSAFHILESVIAPFFPIVAQKISVIALLTKDLSDAESIDFQLQVTLGEQSLLNNPVQVTFQRQLEARIVVDVQGLLIPAPGQLIFSLTRDGKPDASWPILVRKVSPPEVQLQFFPQPINPILPALK